MTPAEERREGRRRYPALYPGNTVHIRPARNKRHLGPGPLATAITVPFIGPRGNYVVVLKLDDGSYITRAASRTVPHRLAEPPFQFPGWAIRRGEEIIRELTARLAGMGLDNRP